MEIKNNIKKLAKNAKAVSPVIATLMLVLVAVASAGGFYVWQAEWQETATEDSGDAAGNIRGYLRLGGSSTIYPVSVDCAEDFMKEYPEFKVEVKSGGSGSGRLGAAKGLIDIGASSSDPSDDYYDEYPDMVGTIIGYDAVVPIVNDMSAVGLQALDDVTISILYGVNGLGATPSECLDEETLPAWASGLTAPIEWDDVPQYPGAPVNVTCSGGPVIVVDRSDVSGTEECFCKKLANELDDTLANDHQIAVSGDYADSGFGNPGVIDKVETTSESLGFAALGLAAEASCDTVYFSPAYDAGATFTGDRITNGTRSGIPSFEDVSSGSSTQFRTLWYLTEGEPAGLAAKFINHLMWTENNINFMHDNGYVSIYD